MLPISCLVLYTMHSHRQTVQPYYAYRRLANRLYTAKTTKDPGLSLVVQRRRLR